MTSQFRALLRPYSPLLKILKRAALLFGLVFVLVTVLPDSLAGFLHPPNVFLGWVVSSASVAVLRAMEHTLLPAGVSLIVIGPFDQFTVIMEIGAYLALTATIPYLLWGFVNWLAPGMKMREVRYLRRLILFATVLFFTGMIVTYLWILPPIYQFSEALSPAVGAQETVSLGAFIETTFLFLFGMGLAFEIPPVCLGLGYIGILHSDVMAKYWNFAGAGCFVIAFLISPGVGGGIIEAGIALGLWGLYWLGYGLVRRLEKSRRMGAIAPAASG